MKENETNLEPLCISTEEAARMLGVSRPTIYKYLGRTDFPSFKMGGRTLIGLQELRDWKAKQLSDYHTTDKLSA